MPQHLPGGQMAQQERAEVFGPMPRRGTTQTCFYCAIFSALRPGVQKAVPNTTSPQRLMPMV